MAAPRPIHALRPVPCPFCGAATKVMPELGGGWRVVCLSPPFVPKPCRALGPVRADPWSAVSDWNEGLTPAATARPA